MSMVALQEGEARSAARSRRAGAGRLVGWAVLVGAGLEVLAEYGRGPLAGPPLASPSRWLPWVEAHEPVVAAFALLRDAAVAAGWYLLVATVLGVLVRVPALARGRVGRASAAVRVLDRLTAPSIRRALEAAAGAGAAMVVGAGVTSPAPWGRAQPALSGQGASYVGAAFDGGATARAQGRSGATMRRVDGPPGPDSGPSDSGPAGSGPSATAP